MEKYEIDELKDELEGLSLQEKRERLEEIQSELISEIEELEAASAEVGNLLSDVQEEMNKKLEQEINTALENVVASHEGKYPLLPNNTIDVEGLQFQFSHYRWDEGKLQVNVEGRKYIVQVRAFQQAFNTLLKTTLPNAHPSEKNFVMMQKEGDDLSAVVKHVAKQLISVAPEIKEIAKEYKFV